MESIDENTDIKNTVVSKSDVAPESTSDSVPERKNYNKTIVFAMMGDKFSYKFMQCWLETFSFVWRTESVLLCPFLEIPILL